MPPSSRTSSDSLASCTLRSHFIVVSDHDSDDEDVFIPDIGVANSSDWHETGEEVSLEACVEASIGGSGVKPVLETSTPGLYTVSAVLLQLRPLNLHGSPSQHESDCSSLWPSNSNLGPEVQSPLSEGSRKFESSSDKTASAVIVPATDRKDLSKALWLLLYEAIRETCCSVSPSAEPPRGRKVQHPAPQKLVLKQQQLFQRKGIG